MTGDQTDRVSVGEFQNLGVKNDETELQPSTVHRTLFVTCYYNLILLEFLGKVRILRKLRKIKESTRYLYKNFPIETRKKKI